MVVASGCQGPVETGSYGWLWVWLPIAITTDSMVSLMFVQPIRQSYIVAAWYTAEIGVVQLKSVECLVTLHSV